MKKQITNDRFDEKNSDYTPFELVVMVGTGIIAVGIVALAVWKISELLA